MPIQEEALDLLIRDLMRIVELSDDRSARTVLRRLRLFQYMHLNGEDMPPKVHPKKVLVLEVAHAPPLICDEYYPTDYGRIHVMNGSYYAMFHREEMIVEHQKTVYDVQAIVYEGDNWPEELLRPGWETIRNYFFGVS